MDLKNKINLMKYKLIILGIKILLLDHLHQLIIRNLKVQMLRDRKLNLKIMNNSKKKQLKDKQRIEEIQLLFYYKDCLEVELCRI